MTLDSSTETVAVLYDIENAPFEMLDYTLGKAQKYLPCRMIVVSDWEKRPEQKRWNRLMSRPGFTFRQIDRKVDGKNSLDYALFDMAVLLRDEGVRKFFVITTDSDFIRIANMLREGDTPSHIIGVGTEQASQLLRDAYDEFFCYPPEKKRGKAVKETKADKPQQNTQETAEGMQTEAKSEKTAKPKRAAKKAPAKAKPAGKAAAEKEPEKKVAEVAGEKVAAKRKSKKAAAAEQDVAAKTGSNLQVQIPKTLYTKLQGRAKTENVDLDQLVTYLLMRGLIE